MGAGIALQSAAADPRIEARRRPKPLRKSFPKAITITWAPKISGSGKTFFRAFQLDALYRDESLARVPCRRSVAEKSVAARAFPVLLICDEKDVALPCAITEIFMPPARSPKQLWIVPGAFITPRPSVFSPWKFPPRPRLLRVGGFCSESNSE